MSLRRPDREVRTGRRSRRSLEQDEIMGRDDGPCRGPDASGVSAASRGPFYFAWGCFRDLTRPFARTRGIQFSSSRARDQNLVPTYLRRLMSDCPCSGNSSVGVTWPTSMPGVTLVLMYFVSPAANWNVTAFSTSVAVVTAYFPGGRSTKAKPPGTDLPTTSLFIRISGWIAEPVNSPGRVK